MGRGALDGSQLIPLPQHLSGSCLRKTPSFLFPSRSSQPNPLHSGLQPVSAPLSVEEPERERGTAALRLPVPPRPCYPLVGWGHPEGCWPFKPLLPTPSIFHLSTAPLPTAGSRGEPRGAGRYWGGGEAREGVMEQLRHYPPPTPPPLEEPAAGLLGARSAS